MPDPADDRAFLALLHRALDAVDWVPLPRPLQATPTEGTTADRYATHEGTLHLPGLGAIPCYQLSTGERVFEAATVIRLLGLDPTEAEVQGPGRFWVEPEAEARQEESHERHDDR
jgi:hypothetical protein